MESMLTKVCRRIMLGAVGVGLACVPWLMVVERTGGDQHPVHLLQTFLAVPVAFFTGVVYLWSGRKTTEGAAWRPFAWVIVVASGLWLAFLAYVLFGADFSWMDQQ
jgi:hypothetical protein